MLLNLSKILSKLLLLKFLLACIMINPISLVILLTSLVFIILNLLIQYVEDARIPQLNPRIHPSGLDVIFKHELDLDQSNCHRLYPLGYSTYPSLIRALLLIPFLGMHNSFAFAP
mgnify:CR=1 FL=1